MGYDLSHWAQREVHPCLTARTRQVLAAICMVAHDDHGEFWMRPQQFITEYLTGMSYGAYRNHLMTLVRNGLLIKIEQGGGRTIHGRGKTTRYRVNSPAVKNPQPDQHKLPDIVRSPEAPPPQPVVSEDLEADATIEMYEQLEELLASGFTPQQVVAVLKAVSGTLSDSRNQSDFQQNQVDTERNQSRKLTGFVDTERNPSENVTGLDDTERNPSRKLTGLDGETSQTEEKPVSFSSTFQRNLSGNVTGTPIHEDKSPEDKKHAAAARENLTGLDPNVSEFFDLLSTTLADAGHPGIRAAQFADLSGFLADYTNLTGSPPDQRTAEYIVGRVSESNGVRNVVGFARKITQDVLTTGEGFVVHQPERTSTPPECPAEPLPPPDWAVLHLAHVEQVSPAQEIWAAVLKRLRNQVSKPAFETWLSEASGAAYAEGRFVIGSANSFASEMVKNRMHPLIVRAVREVVGVKLEIEYAVVASDDQQECPLCHAVENEKAAAAF